MSRASKIKSAIRSTGAAQRGMTQQLAGVTEQLLKAEDEIERLNKLVKFIQDKLRQAIDGNITSDPIVNKIIKRHIARHKQGMEKFGKTMADNNRPTKEWIKEAQEEAIDLILYLEKIL